MTAAPAETAPVRSDPFTARFVGPLLLGSTLNPINTSTIATALVGIGVDFHRGPGTTAVLISVLYLCSAVAQPTMGKLATLFGPRRVFTSGLIILIAAGVIGAAAPAFGFLVVSRALIGIGTSAAFPTAMALVRRRADDAGTGVPARVLGNFSIAAQVTSVVGLPLGGLLAGVFGWRAIFFVNIPLALVALVATLAGVPKDEPRRRDQGSLPAAIDIVGIGLFAGAVIGMLTFLSDLRSPLWWLLPVTLALAATLVVWEWRARSPLIDVRMLTRNGGLLRTYVRQAVVSLGTYTALYGTSQWMEQAAHYSASQVGLILLPLSAISIVIARLVSNRGWVRVPLAASGAALIATGLVMVVITHDSPVIVLIAMSLLFGVASGASGFANQAALYVQAPARQVAVASGLYRTFAYMGAIFSSSLIALTFGSATTDAGLHAIAWVIVGLGAIVALMTLLDTTIPVRTGKASPR
ncbi:MFS transporter [Nocardia cerradoensis]|uniref:MFS transporter n=1 Tax=Nocardia cerradoensis TaxID=85688 RepID=UPI0003124ACC|nr:MFS transporter [Nocardia cerradoensis]NKY43203.1 MFS transporter [Nocardia cerradoensis]